MSHFIIVCVLSETSDQLFAVDQGLITESLNETKTQPGDFVIGRVLGVLASELVKCVISSNMKRQKLANTLSPRAITFLVNLEFHAHTFWGSYGLYCIYCHLSHTHSTYEVL